MFLLALCLATAPAPFDLILEHGRIVDGTGGPWFRGDLGIRGERIAAIGDLSSAQAKRRIDVAERMIAPGFIDLLGQSELFVLIDNRLESKVRQGITTEITGEGGSVAPVNDLMIAEMKPFLDRYHLKVDWRDLPGWYKRVEKNKTAINLGTLVGAATIRTLVLGLDDVQPTDAQLLEMQKLIERAMKDGAFGVSTALIYPPGSYAKTPELIALAKAAAKHGGIYASHIRDEADKEMEALDEAFTIAREAKIPVEIWHLKSAGKKNWGKMKDVIARIEGARAEGLDVNANMYPYAASSNGLSSNVPGWAHAGGIDAMIARFHDPEQRARIAKELWDGGIGAEKAESIMLVSCVNPELKKYMGKRITEVAKEMNKSLEDTVIDIVEADRDNTYVVRFGMSEDDVQLGLRQPWIALGVDNPAQAIDGPFAGESAHPRGFGAAPRLLGHYARDLHLFSVEEIVRRMTSLPARRMKLWDRGLLRPGMIADVTVFSPDKVRDVATFEAPLQYSEGIDFVIVSGKVVLDDGKLTKERPGKVLRHVE